MPERTRQNLETRLNSIKLQMGSLAYNRRDLEIQIERIDEQVAQMEAQGIVIEATLNDLNSDEARANEQALKERADAKEARSRRAKTAAGEKKREKAKETPRKGQATSKT